MPSKSRRKRSKNLPPGKMIKSSGSKSSATAVNDSTRTTMESTANVETPVAVGKRTTSQVQTAVTRYSYISSELRTIGVLAVLILVILGILSAVL